MSEKQITLRQAHAPDLGHLIFLGRTTFIETYKGVGSGRPEGLEEEFGKQEFNEAKLAPAIAAGAFFVADIDRAPAGFLRIERNSPHPSVPSSRVLQVSQLYVLKKHQGAGLGKALLMEAVRVARAEELVGLWLEVWDQNAKAIEFYKRFGFQVVGTSPWRFKAAGFDYEDMDLVLFLKL
jgi:ribosomal protein S18 acetylase RimI-like enzyme